MLASAEILAFLNYSSFTLSFVDLCYSSNYLSAFVLWTKVSTFAFLSSILSSKFMESYSIFFAKFYKFLASSNSSVESSWNFLDSCFKWSYKSTKWAVSELFSSCNFFNLFFLSFSFVPYSLNVSSTSLIYFLISLRPSLTSFSSFFFFFKKF